MSTGGQAVGGLVGGIAGFFLAGPLGASALTSSLYGAQIGMMAGGYLDPPKGPTVNGPRLDDLSVQTSTYGAVIPRVYGTVTVNGNVFWLENNQIKETVTKKKSGGKGGGSKTTTRTYTYSATFAVGLCKGPIAGVRRIWIGPDLIYDAGSADANTIAASNAAASGFTVYNGTDTQSANSRMQATLGAANTPAWRGLAYIVFYDLALARYANSLAGAQVRVEVMTLGATYAYPYTTFTQPNYYWRRPAWDGTVFCTVAYFNHVVATSSDGLTWTTYSIPNGNSAAYLGCASDGAGILLAYGVGASTNMWRSVDHGQTWSACTLPGFSGYVTQVEWNGSYFLAITDSGPFFTSPNGVTWTSQTAPGSGNFARSLAWHPASAKWYVSTQFGSDPIIYSSATAGSGTWSAVYTLTGDLNNFDNVCVHKGRLLYIGIGTVGTYGPCMVWSDDGGTWHISAVPMRAYYILSDGDMCWVGDSVGAMQYSPDGVTNWTSWTGPLQGVNHEGIFANNYIVCLGHTGASGYRIDRTFVSSIFPPLANVVSSECLQSGVLTAGDIDVTALASTTVRGYRIGSVGAIRAALEPLQASWPFDVVQHGYVIRFVARGGASVVTIPAGDLDARGAGQEPGVQITTSREMDSQLPRRVTVQHLDYDREYNAGTQYAERLNTAAINATILDLPIVLTATEAAGKAEVLLYLYWLERYDVSFSLPPTYLQLESGDIVTMTTPEGQILIRIVAVNYTSDGRVECKGKYASPAIYTAPGGTQPVYSAGAVYTSTAVGSSPAVTGPTTVTPVGASVYVLLDVPMVSGAQSGPSFLAAMTGALAGWKGGVLMQSTDAGSSWASIDDFGAPGSEIGTCSNSIGAVDHRTMDNASALAVTLRQGDLFSVTQLALFGGANHFAYGVDGRWEIIAAQTCALTSGTTYSLTNLLRGRFGTEWAMGLHSVGDSLILLDTTDVSAIEMSTGSIGLSYLYRGITVERDISTDSNRAFAYQGVNLKPLSPIALTGAIDPASADWSLTWIRRTRTGGEWRDYVDADIGESSEAYQIDVFADGTYATVKRTLTASSPAATYASADQVSDFGGNQATLYLKLYQMSATVGRGYPLTTSIAR
jgi:hypothetical protein